MTRKKNNRATSPSPSSPSQTTNNNETDDGTDESSITPKFFKKSLEDLKDELFKKFESQKVDIIDHLTNENLILKSEIVSLKESNSNLIKEMHGIEEDVINLQQYIRRNNVEIHGIPDDIEDADLEDKVIEIGETIGVHLKRRDIEACHRLRRGKNDKIARTIVRFINRKKCDDLHTNKYKLKSAKKSLKKIGLNDIYINSNLCPYNKFIWGKCKKLFTEALINRFWVYNGSLYIATEENDKGTKINHLNKLIEIFPGYDFSTKF